MSTVNVLVGQCGNQLGSSFLNALAREAGGGAEAYSEAAHLFSAHDRNMASSFGHHRSWNLSDYHRMVSERHFRRALRARRRDSQGLTKQLPEPRCVLVDMEKQVISQLLHAEKKENMEEDGEVSEEDRPNASSPKLPLFQYSSWQCASRNEGSGNNWAFGYFHQGPSRREAIENCIRRELEVSDTVVRTFHVVHSIAGGTGSGVGSFVAEVIKELQPHTSLLHSAVWPFENGEVTTQWFNLCLTLSALRDTADAIHLLFNDEMVDHLVKHGFSTPRRHSPTTGPSISTPSTVAAALHDLDMPRLNEALASLMVPLHVPQHLFAVPPPRWDDTKHRIISRHHQYTGAATRNEGKNFFEADTSQKRPLRLAHTEDVVEALALDPAMKFFTSTAVPRTAGCGTSTWVGVVTEAARTSHQMFTCVDMFSSFYSPRSCLWCLRGPEASTQGMRELQHYLASATMAGDAQSGHPSSDGRRGAMSRPARGTVPLSALLVHPYAPVFAAFTPNGSGGGGRADTTQHSISPSPQIHLFGATPSIGQHADHAAQRAEQLLAAGAYTHHYERYGVEKDYLMDAVAVTYDVASAYQTHLAA